jgi:RHS repeat-associated protein
MALFAEVVCFAPQQFSSELRTNLISDFAQRFDFASSLLILICLLGVRPCLAQTAPGSLTQFAAVDDRGIDTIDLATGVIYFRVPLFLKPGRGLPLDAHLSYASAYLPYPAFPSWQSVLQNITGSVTYTSENPHCITQTNYTFVDPLNISHKFPSIVTYTGDCKGVTPVLSGAASDGSGLNMTVGNPSATITLPDGATFQAPILEDIESTQWPGASATDANGNTVSVSSSAIVDTTGTTIQVAHYLAGGMLNPATNPPPETYTYIDSNGASETATVNYVMYYSQPPSTAYWQFFVQSIVLSNGTSYQFQYEFQSGAPTGRISSVTLPTGGTIQYSYTGEPGGLYGCDGTCSITRTTSDGPWTYTWTPNFNQQPPTEVNTQVVDPQGNTTEYSSILQWTIFDIQAYETSKSVYQGVGQGTPLLFTETCYNGFARPCSGETSANMPTAPNGTGIVTDVYNSYNGGPEDRTTTDYLTGLYVPIEVDEYDFGAATLLRKTLTQYLSLNGYESVKPTSVVVQDGQGNVASQTTYGYDETAPTSTSQYNVPQYSTVGSARGNLTSVNRWNNVTNSSFTTKNQYDDTGNVLQITDPLGNLTTYSYLDAWNNTKCALASGSDTLAFRTEVTNALKQSSSSTYNSCTGTLASSTDLNKNITSHTYDGLARLVQTNYPDGGQTTVCYTDEGGATCSKSALPLQRVIQTLIGPGTKSETATLDGYGRVTETALTSDPDGATYKVTAYDSDGRVGTVYNPTRCTTPTTNCGETTWGYSSFTYDGLGRPTVTTKADGSKTTNTYVQNCDTVTDEAGKARKSCADALGRLTEVFEDPLGANYETDYAYDPLDDLVSVTQKGGSTASSNWRVRTFTYDSLKRLLCAANPEVQIVTCPSSATGTFPTGASVYSYDANNNLLNKVMPKPGQTGTAVVTTDYSYDALNRLTKKSYVNLSTPTALYSYDGTTLTGCNIAPVTIKNPLNVIGRRSAMCSGNSSSSFMYDYMGRLSYEGRFNKGSAKQYYAWEYTYHEDGSLNWQTYPSGDIIQYTVGGAGRPTQVSEVNSPLNNFVYSAKYAPNGALASMANGYSSSFAGIITSNTYNDRLQPILLSASVSSSPMFSLCYDFHLGISISSPPCNFAKYSSGDNGSVGQIINNLNSARSATFLYDSLNRISQANTTTTSGANCWGEIYSIDPWGNLYNRAQPSGMTDCTYETLSASATTQNQLSVLTYDAAGNVTNAGGGNQPTYDAENRIVTDEAYTYSYDADGRRIAKSDGSLGTMYWPGLGGEILSESTVAGTINEEYIYFNGTRIARIDRPSGTVHYYFSNHLGSASLITDTSGNIEQQSDYYPFGGIAYTSGSDPNHYMFTGKERDSESGLDNFGARYNSSSVGRFMTPDPSNLSVDFLMPQSWNRYSYVLNNPLELVDRNGLWPTWIHDEIIAEAFPGMSSAQIKTLEQASADVDKDQSDWGAPKHGMSDGNWTSGAGNAPEMSSEFINSNEQSAEQIQAAWVASGHTGIAPGALYAFGNALHTITDMTSPSHEGYQPWYGPWYAGPTNALYALVHISGELSISAERKAQAIRDARNAFRKVFATMAAFDTLDAMAPIEVVTHRIILNPPPPPPPPPATEDVSEDDDSIR